MKKPLLNQFQRQCIYLDTVTGAFNRLYIAWMHLLRELDREFLKKEIANDEC